MKHLLFIAFFFALGQLSAQTYGNEWIDYSQPYYKFKVLETGIHKITGQDLIDAGIDIYSFSHENMQVFGREQEVPIYVNTYSGSSTSDFDASDYLLFYAEKNDGWQDKSLYKEPNTEANPGYSLFNDTLYYFFSWNNSTNNLRFESESASNYASYTPVNYVWDKDFSSYRNQYHQGEKFQNTISSSFYVPGEGYGRNLRNGVNGHSQAANALTRYPYQEADAPDARFLGLVYTGSNSYTGDEPSGDYNHHLQWEIGGEIVDNKFFKGYGQVRSSVFVPTTYLSNTTNIQHRIVGDLNVEADKQAMTYWEINYPRVPNFNNATTFEVDVPNSGQLKVRLDIENISYDSLVLLSLGDLPRKLSIIEDAGTYHTLLPDNSSSDRQKLVFADTSELIAVGNITPITQESTYFTDFSTTNFTDAVLMIYHPSLKTGAVAYKNYRTSFDGGAHNVVLGNTEELYLQFGGGIPKHINGIRRFAHFAYKQTTVSSRPKSLFLVGTGVKNIATRNPNNAGQVINYSVNYVPTFGVPSSDVFMTAQLENQNSWAPLIPTGRISVRTNEEVLNYLSKVEEYEIQQDSTDVYNNATKDWQKHFIHLVGGSDASQQTTFNNYMGVCANIAEDSLFAGKGHLIRKLSDSPIPPDKLSELTQRLEDGVSLMTYFGHYGGSSNGFEVNIDDVNNWNNQGKYPVMLVNSCYNGDIFLRNPNSSSEYFVNAENVGAIAYISSCKVGWDVPLYQYSREFYNQFGRTTYGKTIGVNMQKTVDHFSGNNNILYEASVGQIVLNGDPMLKMNSHNKPEINLIEQNVSFSPSEITLDTDSIDITIALNNLGHSVMSTINLEVRRNFPNSETDSIYFIEIPELHYADTFTLRVPLQPSIAVGINTFDISVDIPSFVDEVYDEFNNNSITKTLFVNGDAILPIVPYEFAVVPDDTVTVKASTVNPIGELNTYLFELDTTDLFNSPFLKTATVTDYGGVQEVGPDEWSTPLQLEDSMVYFWRVATQTDDPPMWNERSFQYIPEKEGWGQDHFFQFKKNNFTSINYDRPSRQRIWEPDSISVSVEARPYYSIANAWYKSLEMQEYGDCAGYPNLYVGVIDPVTLETWGTRHIENPGTASEIVHNPDHDFGNHNDYGGGCRNRVEEYFVFKQDNLSQLEAFQNMVLNEVPDGYYVVIYSSISTNYSEWDALDSVDMYNTFATLGSDSIIPGRDEAPFAFFTRKGFPNTAVEDVAAPGEIAQITAYAHPQGNLGIENSTFIGPSEEWNEIYWSQNTIDPTADEDSTQLIIRGYTINKQLNFSTNILFSELDSIMNLNSIVDASTSPYLKISAHYNDQIYGTPAQVDFWHVLYSPLPEAAIDGKDSFYWSMEEDTIQEGEDITFAVDVRNIFTKDMDSLLVNYWIEDVNHQKHPINYPRQDSLRVEDVLRDTITFSTMGFAGYNTFWMEVNPYISPQTAETDQPEQEHNNNLLHIPFHVKGDDENPILDVTFDGRHILNGDIVNPKSEVLITLKDDNELLLMDDISDTTLFGVYLTPPGSPKVRIPFMDAQGNTVMQWIPANSSNKKFKIIFPAEFEKDGDYNLLVQGADRSGNLSGDYEYNINFEVIHESTITNMMNYPNPFSTNTHFVFTLTGSEVPDDIIIRIMTVSGRVVREITEDELGPIHIGRNVTEYTWNGRDEFGDQLANGVYLYTVQSRINGESIEHRDSGADKYFKKKFGKMYLMR